MLRDPFTTGFPKSDTTDLLGQRPFTPALLHIEGSLAASLASAARSLS